MSIEKKADAITRRLARFGYECSPWFDKNRRSFFIIVEFQGSKNAWDVLGILEFLDNLTNQQDWLDARVDAKFVAGDGWFDLMLTCKLLEEEEKSDE